MRRSVVATLRAATATLALAAGACFYDADDRCSLNQVLVDDTRCECGEGSAFTPDGCIRSGENDVAGPNGCDCAEGLSRPTPDADCQPAAPAVLGLDCNVASAPCGDPRDDHCRVLEGDDGYCTIAGCTSSADCDGGYECQVGAEPPDCRRPPVGLGRACQSPADCAEGEANFCDMLVSRTCLELFPGGSGLLRGSAVLRPVDVWRAGAGVPAAGSLLMARRLGKPGGAARRRTPLPLACSSLFIGHAALAAPPESSPPAEAASAATPPAEAAPAGATDVAADRALDGASGDVLLSQLAGASQLTSDSAQPGADASPLNLYGARTARRTPSPNRPGVLPCVPARTATENASPTSPPHARAARPSSSFR